MSFRDNLLKKIKLDRTAKKVLVSIKPAGNIHKIDKVSMKYLLSSAEYTLLKKRDLELYYKEEDNEKKRILVLDNDLTIYHTTIDDVVLRKSPYVKEMISIRNVIKILNDADVVESKKEASVRTIQKECIEMLDLSFDENDLQAIEKSGKDALTISDTGAVMESITLFGEILGYVIPPKSFIIRGHTVICNLIETEDQTKLYGPIVLYNDMENRIKLINDQMKVIDKEKIQNLHKTASGRRGPDMEGADVFTFLKQEAEKVKYIRS